MSFDRQGLHDMKTDILTLVFNRTPEFTTVVGDLFFKVHPRSGKIDFDNSAVALLSQKLKALKMPDAMAVNAMRLYNQLKILTLLSKVDMPENEKNALIYSVMTNPEVASEKGERIFLAIIEKYFGGVYSPQYKSFLESLNKTQKRLFSEELKKKFLPYYASSPEDPEAVGPFHTKKGLKSVGMNTRVTQGRSAGKHLTDIATRNKLTEGKNLVSLACRLYAYA